MAKYYFITWDKCPKCGCRLKIHNGQYIIEECQSKKCDYKTSTKRVRNS